MQPERRHRRRQILARDGTSALLEKRKGSPCQQDDSSPPQSGKRVRYTDLPKDIWQHIHSLLPLRDAARTACVSRAFLHSWRHHSNLTFTFETICSINVATDFTKTVSHIMKKHSGIGVKALKIDLDPFYSIKACSCLDTWLQIAVTPRIQELTLVLSRCSQPSRKAYYNFPCSLLSDGGGSLIQVLHLRCCTFHPTAKLGSFGSLTRLHLISVHISGDELGFLLSNSLVLDQLILNYCDEITYVKVPFRLQQLSYMEVYHCDQLQVIENKAPNLRNLRFIDGRVQLSFGESLLVKNIYMLTSNVLCHACVELPSVSPNLESLTIVSSGEMVNTCTVPRKFLHLKYLHIALSGINMLPSYDYFSLVSFLDASPSLETFILDVTSRHTENDSIFVDSLHLRQMPEHRHDNLRNVKITCFRSAKSLVELTCHILKNASVKCLTLDTTRGYSTCSTSITGRCFSMGKEALMEAHKALLAISTYIEGKVSSSVITLNIVPPCSRCHAIEF